jgi:hypothetical protein
MITLKLLKLLSLSKIYLEALSVVNSQQIKISSLKSMN